MRIKTGTAPAFHGPLAVGLFSAVFSSYMQIFLDLAKWSGLLLLEVSLRSKSGICLGDFRFKNKNPPRGPRRNYLAPRMFSFARTPRGALPHQNKPRRHIQDAKTTFICTLVIVMTLHQSCLLISGQFILKLGFAHWHPYALKCYFMRMLVPAMQVCMLQHQLACISPHDMHTSR